MKSTGENNKDPEVEKRLEIYEYRILLEEVREREARLAGYDGEGGAGLGVEADQMRKRLGADLDLVAQFNALASVHERGYSENDSSLRSAQIDQQWFGSKVTNMPIEESGEARIKLVQQLKDYNRQLKVIEKELAQFNTSLHREDTVAGLWAEVRDQEEKLANHRGFGMSEAREDMLRRLQKVDRQPSIQKLYHTLVSLNGAALSSHGIEDSRPSNSLGKKPSMDELRAYLAQLRTIRGTLDKYEEEQFEIRRANKRDEFRPHVIQEKQGQEQRKLRQEQLAQENLPHKNKEPLLAAIENVVANKDYWRRRVSWGIDGSQTAPTGVAAMRKIMTDTGLSIVKKLEALQKIAQDHLGSSGKKPLFRARATHEFYKQIAAIDQNDPKRIAALTETMKNFTAPPSEKKSTFFNLFTRKQSAVSEPKKDDTIKRQP